MQNLYLGIDLGTTNSELAYGNLSSKGNLTCNILEIDRQAEGGGKERKRTLPSVVFYSKDINGNIFPIVGDYAKGRYGTKFGYVCKSVKSRMGLFKDVDLNEEIPDKTPPEVSAQIIKHMLNCAEKRLFINENKDDVVITVPASFDSDQCQATLDAAKIAGINTDNQHDILLYEPKAVIYNFVNMQESGEIPSELIDFSSPKNILVFDLGGGTLDVTIHKVGYNENGMMNIRDIAISRYSQIGGDNFDEFIAEGLLERFKEYNPDVIIPKKRKEEVLCKLRKLAERAKIEMSDAYDTCINMGRELQKDFEVNVTDMNIYDSYSFDEDITRAELEKMIEPMMAYNLTIADVARIDSITEKDMNNIIYPIIDVLAKAGGNVKIDAVLLNGGMTKFFPVKERIDKFLSLNSICTADPDLAVARGAVYYHYCLHKYNVPKSSFDDIANKKEIQEFAFNTGTILNDTINLGIRGEYISKLVEAGTELPYESPEIKDKYVFSDNTDTVAIEIFLGRGKTKNLPNRRIATRVVTFNKKYPVGTFISLKLKIDAMRNMQIEAWITNKPYERAVVTVDATGKTTQSLKTTASRVETKEKITLNAKSEMHQLKDIATRTKTKTSKTGFGSLTQKATAQLERILSAKNPEDFYDVVFQQLSTSRMDENLRGYLYVIAISFAKYWSETQQKKVLNMCKQHFSDNFSQLRQKNYVLKQAISYIAKYDPNALTFLQELLNSHKYNKLNYHIINKISYIMRMNGEYESLISLIEKSSPSDIGADTVYNVAYCFSRENNFVPCSKLEKVFKVISKTAEITRIDGLYASCIFAIAEMFDRRAISNSQLPSDSLTALALSNIEEYSKLHKKTNSFSLNELEEIVQEMLKGQQLSPQYLQHINKLREFNYNPDKQSECCNLEKSEEND